MLIFRFFFLQVNLLKVVRSLVNMVKANCQLPWQQVVWQLLFRNCIPLSSLTFYNKESYINRSLHTFLLFSASRKKKQIKANIIIFVDCNLIISSCVHCAMLMLCYELSANFSSHLLFPPFFRYTNKLISDCHINRVRATESKTQDRNAFVELLVLNGEWVVDRCLHEFLHVSSADICSSPTSWTIASDYFSF